MTIEKTVRYTGPEEIETLEKAVNKSLTAWSKEISGKIIDEMKRQTKDYDYEKIDFAISEAIKNAHRYGNMLNSKKQVTITYKIQPDKISVEISDQADSQATLT